MLFEGTPSVSRVVGTFRLWNRTSGIGYRVRTNFVHICRMTSNRPEIERKLTLPWAQPAPAPSSSHRRRCWPPRWISPPGSVWSRRRASRCRTFCTAGRCTAPCRVAALTGNWPGFRATGSFSRSTLEYGWFVRPVGRRGKKSLINIDHLRTKKCCVDIDKFVRVREKRPMNNQKMRPNRN